MYKQKDSLALVTGATSGIGRALCCLLAKQGISIIAVGRNVVQLNTLVDELKNITSIDTLVADLATVAGRSALIDVIWKRIPTLIINSAGFGLYGESLSYETERYKDMLNVNGMAVLESTLEGARALIGAGKSGVILNISSASDRLVFPGLAVYASSKAFVTQFSRSVDFELQRHGVRVLVSCPGVIATGFREAASGKARKPDWNDMTSEYAAERIWKQIERRKSIDIFNWKTRFGLFITSLLPTSWVTKFLSNTVLSYNDSRSLILKETKNKS